MLKSLLRKFLLGIIIAFFVFGNGVKIFAGNMEKTPILPDTENYLEIFSEGDIESTMYNLFVESIENGKIKFYAQFFVKKGTVVSEDRIAFWVNTELNNNKCDFTWTDTYLSTGTGSLEIYEDYCVINMQEIKKSELAIGNLVTMTTNDSMILPSIMNKGTSYKKIQEFSVKNKINEDKNTPINTTKTTIKVEYIYNEQDNIPDLPWEKLDNITDEKTAIEVVQEAEKVIGNSASDIDYITLFAEEAIARVATIDIEASDIVINDDMLAEAKAIADNISAEIKKVSSKAGKYRAMNTPIRIKTSSSDTVNISKSKTNSGLIEVVTPYASVKYKGNDIAEMSLLNEGNGKVKVNFTKNNNTSIIPVSLPVTGDTKYKAIFDSENNAVGGKFNPTNNTLTAKISTSGVFSIANNEKDFSDIKDKAVEMQEAIKLLASKGIINGTSKTEFSPDKSISRAEVAAIILRTISKLDENADGGFSDVKKENWFFGTAGSAKNAGIINGYEDNTFRGNVVIPKEQIVSVSARVLKNEMGYYDVDDVGKVLSEYGDSGEIAQWAKSDVALATDANMVIKRTDGLFGGKEGMTRGDAAIILKRLLDKIW